MCRIFFFFFLSLKEITVDPLGRKICVFFFCFCFCFLKFNLPVFKKPFQVCNLDWNNAQNAQQMPSPLGQFGGNLLTFMLHYCHYYHQTRLVLMYLAYLMLFKANSSLSQSWRLWFTKIFQVLPHLVVFLWFLYFFFFLFLEDR